MAFPVSPIDGQSATVNNIVYVYSSSTNTWTRTSSGFVNLGASGNISAVGNIIGNYIIGNIVGNTIANSAITAGTVTTNAQPNITSVGTLTSITSTGLISTTGNIAGNYIFGNGSQLSGIVANTINTQFNGTANTFYLDFVPSNGANNQSVYNSPFLTYIPTTGILGASAVSATGNITGNYIIGNGSQLTGLPASYGNSNVLVYLSSGVAGNIIPSANATYNLGSPTAQWAAAYFGANTVYLGTTSLSANNISNTLTISGNIVVTQNANSNISAGNVTTSGIVSATGNVTGNYILGNGALLTGVSTSSSNINNGTSNVTVVSSGGNVTTGIGGTANVVVVAATGQYVTGLVSASGNITGGNLVTTGLISASGNIQVGNIRTSGAISATGNIIGSLISATGNIDAAGNILADGYASVTGNIIGNYIITNGSGGSISGTGNIIGGNLLTSGQLSATGNVTGNYIIGNGSSLTSITAANVSGTVANATYALSAGSAVGTAATVTTNAQPNITSVGTLTTLSVSGNATAGNVTTSGTISVGGIVLSGNLIVGAGPTLTIDPNGSGGTDGNVVITGNLTVQGTTTTINSNTITTNDLQINMANNAANATAANNGGIGVGPVGSEYATLLYNTASNVWVANLGISSVGNLSTGANVIATGNVTGNYFIGNGSQLTSLTGANVTGTVANATYALSAGSAVGTAATVTTNAQPNITSVGTLTTLSVTGNATAGNILTAGIMSSTGNAIHGNVLTAGVVSATGNVYGANIISGAGGNITGANIISGNTFNAVTVSASGNVTGNYILGNGALLTGVSTSSSNINNGTSNITVVGANANITVGVSGTGNVVVFAPTGEYVTGVLSVSGNTTAGNILTAGVVSATGNVYGANIISGAGTGGNITGANIISGNTFNAVTVSASGNITTAGNIVQTGAGNINGYNGYFSNNFTVVGTLNVSTGAISAVGNTVTGNGALYAGVSSFTSLGSNVVAQFAGNANSYSQLNFQNINSGTAATTEIIVTANNGNDVAYFGDFGIAGNTYANASPFNSLGTSVSPNDTYLYSQGNANGGGGNLIIGSNERNGVVRIIANGSNTANVVATFANGGVSVTGIVSATGNITGSLISATGNVDAAGNILADGYASVTGNITGNYFIGNGSLLTGISAGSGGSNISNGTSNVTVVSSGGNITTGVGGTANIIVVATTGQYVTGVVSASGNVTAGNILTTGIISATGSNSVLGPVSILQSTSNTSLRTAFNQALQVRTALGNGTSVMGIMNESANAYSLMSFIDNNGIEQGGVGFANPSASYTNFANAAYLYSNGSNGLILSANVGAVPGTRNLWITNAGLVTIPGSTAAANTTSGAFQVTGGVGIGGNIYAGSLINATGNITGGNITTAGLISATGNITGNNIYTLASFGVGTAPSGTTGEIRATNNITAFYSSDARLKENVQPISDALNIVDAVGGKLFDWTDDYIASKGGEDGYFTQKADFGVIAQDLKEVFPLAVRTREDGTLAVDYPKLVAIAFAAISELRMEIDKLKKSK